MSELPTAYVSAKTDADGCVIVVHPTEETFDEAYLTGLLDSSWYEELGKLPGVDHDVAFSPRELLIGHSRANERAFMAIVLPKLREKFTIVTT